MKKLRFIVAFLLLLLVGCSSGGDIKGKITPEELAEFPVAAAGEVDRIWFSSLEDYICFAEPNPVTLAEGEVLSTTYYIDWHGNMDSMQLWGHTTHRVRIKAVGLDNTAEISPGAILEISAGYFLLPAERSEVYRFLLQNGAVKTGDDAQKEEAVQARYSLSLPNGSYLLEPERGVNYTWNFVRNQLRLREGETYTFAMRRDDVWGKGKTAYRYAFAAPVSGELVQNEKDGYFLNHDDRGIMRAMGYDEDYWAIAQEIKSRMKS